MKNMPQKYVPIEIIIEIPTCEPKKCRTNCRKNPNCFSQLGEKFWLNSIKENHWVTNEDPNDERKEQNGHVGLKNLGATCYVNTFLQLWFHNKPLREAVYNWRPIELPEKTIEPQENGDMLNMNGPKHVALSFGDDSTKSICGSLQYLFSLLEFSKRRYVDPSPLVRSLGLQTDEQQDAQEFSKLFISLLQEALSSQGHKNIVEEQFGGTYVYETKCGFCQSVSERCSKFYELDLNIKGHLKLSQCLKEFLKEEFLEGDNQYYCSMCLKKQDATRRIVLRQLPQVLNLQLLRFVFDRQTFTKRKLNNVINFPDVLNMNDFVKLRNKEDGIYHLKAVLIHKGLSANSGHYIAHIRDQQNEVWCGFNDESVDIVKGKTLQLAEEEALNEENKGKSVKKLDGHNNSKNAYMLVYTKKLDSDQNNDPCINPPEYISDVVEQDNNLFEEWVTAVQIQRDQTICEGLRKQETIKDLYTRLPVKDGKDFEWISTKWLRSWMNFERTCNITSPIDNTELMCVHSCLDPMKVSLAKRISATAASDLFDKYGGLPRLQSDSMCKKCLEFIKSKHLFENKLQDDLKLISRYSKQKSFTGGFWVGKKSMKLFKQLATKEFLNSCDIQENSAGDQSNAMECLDNTTESACDDIITESAGDDIITESAGDNNNNDNNGQDNTLDTGPPHPSKGVKQLRTFNQDAVCPEHANLCLDKNLRKLVSKDVWSICKQYFPSLKEFKLEVSPCVDCHKKQLTDEEEKETLKMFVSNQKQSLSFLLDNPATLLNAFLMQQMAESNFYIVASSFVNAWRKRMKLQKCLEDATIDNTDMICEHDLSLYSPEDLVDELSKSDPDIIVVSEEQKEKMKHFFTFDPEIKLTKGGTMATTTYYKCSPDFCQDCRSVRLSEEAFDSKSFSNAPIYVRKLTHDHNITVNEAIKKENDSSDVNIVDEIKFYKEKREALMEATNSPKRFKMSQSQNGAKRRSNRYRRQRGEYVIYVNSHQTLRELKVQLLSAFSVFPMEQVLTLEDGIALTDDDKFLVDLRITAGKHLYLSVAEQDKNQFEVSPGKETVELGFKGTNLCGGGI